MGAQNYIIKVTANGVTFNPGKLDEPVLFFRGAKTAQEASAMQNNPDATREEWTTDNGRKMVTISVSQIVKMDFSKVATLKSRTALLNSL